MNGWNDWRKVDDKDATLLLPCGLVRLHYDIIHKDNGNWGQDGFGYRLQLRKPGGHKFDDLGCVFHTDGLDVDHIRIPVVYNRTFSRHEEEFSEILDRAMEILDGLELLPPDDEPCSEAGCDEPALDVLYCGDDGQWLFFCRSHSPRKRKKQGRP